MGRYSQQIGNLEDMVFLALADGAVQDAEKHTIIAFAREIGTTQEQVDRITAEAAARVKAQNSGIACARCGMQSPAAARFCPGCGAPLQPAASAVATRLAFEYPSSGVAIEFSESTAVSFAEALQQAQVSPIFQEILRSRKRWYLAGWPSGKVGDTLPLIRCLKGMRNRKVYVDGEEHSWDEVFGFLWCLEERSASYRPVEHCFGMEEKRPNLWGCRQLSMEWTAWADWFSYGRFVSKDVFCFDKERITHELDVHLHKVRYCPYIRSRLIGAALKHLPDRVRVAEHEGWAYKESYQQTPNSIRVVTRETESGMTITNEFYSDGVTPVGFVVARAVLCKALAESGVNDVDVNVILP